MPRNPFAIQDSIELENIYDQLIRHLVPRHAEFNWLLIKAQMKQESRFNPLAISHAGARGLMQTMPATDKWIDDENDGYDIMGNIEDGVSYMMYLYRYWTYKGIDDDDIVQFALASYNAGQGNIRKAWLLTKKKKTLDPNLWKNVKFHLELVTGNRSRETVDYVDRVMKYYMAYQPPSKPIGESHG